MVQMAYETPTESKNPVDKWEISTVESLDNGLYGSGGVQTPSEPKNPVDS